jgi:fibronectin type 3 domain-containing protein
LNPQQSTALQIQFRPTAAGAMTGTLAISSNASGSPVSVSLNGTGTTTPRVIDLSWDAPASASTPIVGYNIYRSVAGGGFQLLNSSAVAQTSYADKTVTSGTTYNFYVKAVDQNKVESVASNRIALTVP